MKLAILLHFYKEGKFIGQKIHCVEFSDPKQFFSFVDLLAQGRKEKDFVGTEDLPKQTPGFVKIKYELAKVYENPYRLGYPPNVLELEQADEVRVMQILTDFSFAPTALYS